VPRTLVELKAEIPFDKWKLDDEVVKQAQLYDEAGDGWAEAVSKRDQAKQVLEQLEAELAHAFRNESMEKITEARVTEHVARHPDYVQQYRLYLNYKRESDEWLVLKEAFAQRCTMIREEVNLHTTGYWGSGVDSGMIESYKSKYRNRNNEE